MLGRHLTGRWGELPDEDKAANDAALEHGGRLLSCYRTEAGERVWIITEADDRRPPFYCPRNLTMPAPIIAPPSTEAETLRALHRLASSLPDAQADAVHAVAAVARELAEAARELHIMADARPRSASRHGIACARPCGSSTCWVREWNRWQTPPAPRPGRAESASNPKTLAPPVYPVHDHIIVGRNGHSSLKGMGLF